METLKGGISGQQLRSFIEKIERLEQDKAEINEVIQWRRREATKRLKHLLKLVGKFP